MRSLLSALLLSAIAVPALASGAAISSPWNTGVMKTQEGAFAYCVSEAQYDNGLWLILALNPTGDVNIGVGQKGAQLPQGGQRNSVLQIDGQTAIQVPARVVKPELYVLNAGKNAALLQALASGSSVKIDSNTFSLSGSGQAVSTLKECVQVSSAAPTAAPTPVVNAQAAPPSDWVVPGQQPAAAPQVAFDGPVPQAEVAQTLAPELTPAAPEPAPTAATLAQAPLVQASPTPADAQALTALTTAATQTINPPEAAATPTVRPLPAQLNALLVKAGVRDIEPTAVGDGSKFAWLSRTMKGQVREQTVTPGSDLGQLVERELARLKAACSTEFSSWPGAIAPEAVGTMQLMTAQTRCRGNGRSDYSTHVFALTRSGLLSVISHETPGGTRAAADRAQAGLINALKGISG